MSDYVPTGYLRKVLSPGEKVLYVVRQHGIFLFWRMFIWLVLAAGIAAACLFMMSLNANAVIGLPFMLLPLLVVWWQWLEWSNHAYFLTTRRVIQVTGVFSKEVIDSLLEKLNDIKTDQTLLGRMFDYGDVEILTANEVGNNVFRHIAHPLTFKTQMLDAKQALDTAGVKS
ncbi:MAG TPA: PH domain-containing protein [Caulobacteraceae bacterium]|jgi:uncharacterized membrane protein YdbT with pleckstrin-like domain|nr:PH domain-containing protein [Caulobacteraceae bacterium]